MTTTTTTTAAPMTRAAQARVQDIRDMIDAGENVLGVAYRLGITTDSVYKFLRKHQEYELAARLQVEAPGKLRTGRLR